MNINWQQEIITSLQQAQAHAERGQWQETIVTCQRVIEYCNLQLSDSAATTNPEIYLSNGDRALAKGEVESAIAQYDLAIQLAPDLPQAHKKLADALAQKGEWEKATTYYRQAIKLKKSSAVSTVNKSQPISSSQIAIASKIPTAAAINTLSSANNTTATEGNVGVVVRESIQAKPQNHPDTARQLANLGNSYARQQLWQQAIAAYQQALKIDPNLAVVCRNLGQVAYKNGQIELATDSWYRALKLEPTWATPEEYLKLGNSLEQQQKNESAIFCYRSAIAQKPNFTDAYLRLANLFSHLQQLDEGFKLAEELQLENPQGAAVYLYRGRILEAKAELSAASAAYEQAVQIDAQLWQAFYYWAEISKRRGEWQEAATIYRRAIAANPDVFLLQNNLGFVSFKLQNWSESKAAFHQAIALNPAHPWCYVHLGIIDLLNCQWEGAIAQLLQAIALNSELTGIYKHLGVALRKYCLSIEDLETTTTKVATIIPFESQNQTADFYCQIATHLSQAKQYDGAIVFYNLAAKLQPDNPNIFQQLQQTKEQQQQLQLNIIDCQQQIIANPQAAWKYAELGNTFADLGDREAAIKLHRQGSILRGWELAAERNYRFQYDWFTHNIPVWQKQLHSFSHTSVNILEIGSFEGMATCWLLDYVLTHPSATITCIDIYFQDNFEGNIAQTHGKDKLTQLCGNSHEILTSLTPNSYEIIYIDGSHLANDVLQDAKLSWDLLKVKGLIIFDDYLLKTPENPQQEPKIGIDTFLETITNCYEILHQNYQLIIQKTA
ncbi:MAG: tetratricopeptide repeat protein [Pleurocapsa sp.]